MASDACAAVFTGMREGEFIGLPGIRDTVTGKLTKYSVPLIVATSQESPTDSLKAQHAMLTFNMLLKEAKIAPSEVRLVRHRGSTPAQQRKMRDMAFALDVGFQRYQERQSTQQVIEQFRAAKYIAGFVAEPLTKRTVFVGLWERLGERVELLGDPISTNTAVPNSELVEFNTQRLPQFDQYVGRLVIDWGEGTRAWVQRADNQDKRIIELRQEKSDPKYPGHLALKVALNEVEALYSSWVQVLRNARGVYLLVHRDSGKQYVGSAYGAEGFFGRWSGYTDGHGGNVALKDLGAPAAAFDATILEVAGTDATAEDILGRESLWKDKLGTRAKGLNRN